MADKQSAQAVTFNRAVGVRSVTLEGDVYDPSGTLSGGAAPSSSGILVQVQELNSVQREVDEIRTTMGELDRQLQSKQQEVEAYRKDKRLLELRSHEVGLLEEQVKGSTAAKVCGHVLS
jgi:structural maintenance of chromosome 2